MARLNVYVPDELAARARSHGLNVSALTQQAISTELGRYAMDAWLGKLDVEYTGVSHADVQTALDDARAEFGAS